MDFQQLLYKAPDISGRLKMLGFSGQQLGALGEVIDDQLARGDRIDVIALAQKSGISEELAGAAAAEIEPGICAFRRRATARPANLIPRLLRRCTP